jgi:hypothetical protein
MPRRTLDPVEFAQLFKALSTMSDRDYDKLLTAVHNERSSERKPAKPTRAKKPKEEPMP